MVALADEVVQSLQLGQVVPFFQPLVRLREGDLRGFEILTRWAHPAAGLILPPNYIAQVEALGMMAQLTRTVLGQAFAVVAALPEVPALSVNISPSQLKDAELPALIREAQAQTGYPLSRLTIEITESALLEDLDLARAAAAQLKAMGCRLSLDDFGTGYSSLHHLRSLPFDELKIDRSFVASMSQTRESRKIVAAVVGLGRSLGLTTVGEGIESEEHAKMLSWLGCEIGQGYLYSRPVGAECLPALLAATPARAAEAASMGDYQTSHYSLEAMPEQRLALLQAIYDGSPSYLCCLNRSLRYVSLNKRLAELNGFSVADHLGKHVQEMVPHTYPRIEKHLLRALAGQAATDVELFRPAERQGQRDKRLSASYQPMLDEAGEVNGVLVAMVDITARKQAESALRRRDAQSRLQGLLTSRR